MLSDMDGGGDGGGEMTAKCLSWHLYSLQSFSVPGSMWLSILGGALFNFWLTLFTVSLVYTTPQSSSSLTRFAHA